MCVRNMQYAYNTKRQLLNSNELFISYSSFRFMCIIYLPFDTIKKMNKMKFGIKMNNDNAKTKDEQQKSNGQTHLSYD